MYFPRKRQVALFRTGIKHGRQSDVVWLDAGILHGGKEAQCFVGELVLRVSGNERTPEHDVSVGQLVKDSLCIGKTATFTIHIHQRCVDYYIARYPLLLEL